MDISVVEKENREEEKKKVYQKKLISYGKK